jgi:hypothetical protein
MFTFKHLKDNEMDAELNSKYRYQIGPSDELKREIGQIVANHGLCEVAIYSLFVTLLGAPSQNVRILVKSQSLKAHAMTNTIKALLDAKCANIDDAFKQRIISLLEAYKAFTKERNKIVHWQWEATTQPTASITNSIGAIDPQLATKESMSIARLRDVALVLAEVASGLLIINNLIGAEIPIEVSKMALKQYDEIMLKVRDALSILPPSLTRLVIIRYNTSIS